MLNEKNLGKLDAVMVFTVMFYHGLMGIGIYSIRHTLIMLGDVYTAGNIWALSLILAISAVCAAYLCWRVITLTARRGAKS